MFIIGYCKKCMNRGILDVGNMEITEAIKVIQKMEFGECKFGGFHVEMGKMIDYIVLNTDKTFETQKDAETHNETLNKKIFDTLDRIYINYLSVKKYNKVPKKDIELFKKDIIFLYLNGGNLDNSFVIKLFGDNFIKDTIEEYKKKSINYINNLKEYFNLKELQKNIDRSISNIKNDIDLYENDNYNKITVVEEIVSSGAGQYIPQELCQILEINECQNIGNDSFWDAFQEVESQISDDINKIVKLPEKYNLYFGNTENGDYCLFLNYSIEE